MSITYQCKLCGHGGQAADRYAGKRVKCPECKESIDIANEFWQADLEDQAITNERRDSAPIHTGILENEAKAQTQLLKSIARDVNWLFWIALIGVVLSVIAGIVSATR